MAWQIISNEYKKVMLARGIIIFLNIQCFATKTDSQKPGNMVKENQSKRNQKDDWKKNVCTIWLNNSFNSDNTEFVCQRPLVFLVFAKCVWT